MNKTVLIVAAGIGVLVLVGLGVLIMTNSKSTEKPIVEAARVETMPENMATGDKTDTEMASQSGEASVTTSGKVTTVTVEGNNFAFIPKEIKVKKGDTVKVTFKNIEGFHDFVIDEFEVKTNQIKEGEEEEVEFVASKAGIFEYYCSVGKHRQMGMVGKLIVE